MFTLLLLAAAGGGAWWYLQQRGDLAPQFRSVVVQRGSIIQSVTATGQLEPVVSVEVGSQVSGRLQEVLVDFNDRVTKGQLLAEIDPATFEAAVSQAETELVNAKASLKLAQVGAERTERLFGQSLVSQAELEQAQAQLQQAEAAVRIREFALESRQTDLERCTIYAPIDGVVISRNVEMGQTVAASLNAPVLFTIANDLTQMQIKASVSEADIGVVAEQQDVNFTVDAFPGRTFEGKISQVRNAPESAEGVVSYACIVDVENPDLRLKPGMTANVSIVIARRDDAVRLPNAALRVRLPEELLPPEPERPAGLPGRRTGGGDVAVGSAGATLAATGGAPDAERRRRRATGDGPGGGGFPGGGAGGGWQRRDGGGASSFATIYRLTGPEEASVLEAVRVRTGITDGSYTEVLSGVAADDRIVTGLIVQGGAIPAGASSAGGNNPFSGGGRGGRRF